MIELADLAKLAPNQSAQLRQHEFAQLYDSGLRELARRSTAGVVILPLCTALGLLATDFSRCITEQVLWIFAAMVALACLRGWTLWTIHRCRIIPVRILYIFGFSCLGMAACWGTLSAFYLTPGSSPDGHVYIFTVILTAGICAAAVANFCIWKRLAGGFILLALGPGVGAALMHETNDSYFIAAAMSLFACYLLVQLEHWHKQYWLGMATSSLAEKQARQLSSANKELQRLIAAEHESRLEILSSREKLRHLFDHALDGFLICTEKGLILEVNGTCKKIIGRGHAELLSINIIEVISEADSDISLISSLQLAFQGSDVEMQAISIPKEGRQVPLHLRMRKMVWRDEFVLFVTLRDISVQTETEGALDMARLALQESEGYLRAILQNVELPIYCKDMDGKYVTVNEQFEKLCSLSGELIRGREDRDLFPVETAAFFRSRDDELINHGRQVGIEGVVLLASRKQDLLIHKFALKRQDGTVYGTAGICTDKTLMKNALQAAQVAQEAKTEFLARMSHELRTPLHAVLSFARLGIKRAETVSRDKLLFYFNMIVSSGDQLLDLLNNLFDAATHERFLGEYRYIKADLREDLDFVVQQFTPLMAERQVVLTTDIPDVSMDLRYDRVKLLQVLRNLLANALKYSRPDTQVWLLVAEDTLHGTLENVPAWRVSLVDQGVGLEESDCERIFQQFVQGRTSCQVASGVGLGLAICKDIIEDHGGTIWACNNEEGGATFSFVLPKCED